MNERELGGMEHNRVVDLSDDGERWEGDVLERKPYGWGVLYDGENRMAYEGFRIGSTNVCFGRSYYSDIQKVEYEGEICEGRRWGRGTHYDRNGNTVFDGEWMNDDAIQTRVVMSEESPVVHCSVEELVVGDNCCNDKEWTLLDLSLMPNLRDLRVGNKCFMSVKEVKLIELHQLESVTIGNECCEKEENSLILHKGAFYLKDCEKLKRLNIGSKSFTSYHVCEIANVPSLEEIEMSSWTFTKTVVFELKGE